MTEVTGQNGGHCLRILLVEDNTWDVELIERQLRQSKLSYQLRQVANPIAFVQHLKGFRPHAVLCDFRMPTFDGMEALELLKAEEPQIPFILVSGTLTDEIAGQCLSLGVDDYVLKSNLKRLPSAIANAIKKKQLEAQLRQAQKMECVGQLAAGVAHDFNNLLQVIQGYASFLISSGESSYKVKEALQQITLAADRAARLTRQLLTFSRTQVLQPKLHDLNEIMGNLDPMLHSLLGETITLQLQPCPRPALIKADANLIEQLIINLSLNARDAMSNGGILRIKTTVNHLDERYLEENPEARKGDFVCLEVADTGCGMDPNVIRKIFEPFFTTKEVGKGTGLGLASAYRIARQHYGWIDVGSEIGKGTTFQIFLPKISETTQFLKRKADPQEIRGGTETILMAEDEPAVRDLVQEFLQAYGYTVLPAGCAKEALKIWAQHQEDIQLLFTDLMMPGGISGHQLAEHLKAQKPSLKTLYTSAYSLEMLGEGGEFPPSIRFLPKPYQLRALAEALRQCLDAEG